MFDSSEVKPSRKDRAVFPVVCKWFESGTDQPVSPQASNEVGQRLQQFKISGKSPCDDCPLCQGHK